MMKEKIYAATMKEILEIKLPMFYQSNDFDRERERERANGRTFSYCATFIVWVFPNHTILGHQNNQDRTLKALNYKVTICITHHFLFQETFSLSPENCQHLHRSSFLIQETFTLLGENQQRFHHPSFLVQETRTLSYSRNIIFISVICACSDVLHHYEIRKDDCF